MTATKTHTFSVSTDSASAEYQVATADEAAAEFAAEEGIRGVTTAAELEAYLERVGGYGSVENMDTGEVAFRIAAN